MIVTFVLNKKILSSDVSTGEKTIIYRGATMNIKDIARICGVGVSTVSRVLNNHPDVKKETRDRVLDVIKEYNYIPNNSARILKSNNTNQIGVLVKGVFNPFFSEMVQIIEEKLHSYGYSMILQHYDYKDSNDLGTLVSFIKEKRLSGVICLGGNFEGIKEQYLDHLDVHIVLTSVDKSVAAATNLISTVNIDNEFAAYKAVKYLINTGHTHIGLLLGDEYDAGIGNKRALGYMKALGEAGIQIKKEYIVVGGYNFDEAYKTTKKLLATQKEITALFAISDIMAVGGCKAAIDSGYRIPEDLSIIGFDGMDIAKYYNPSLTTIKQPQIEMATQSVQLLMELMIKKKKNRHVTLPTQLIEGGSCRRSK